MSTQPLSYNKQTAREILMFTDLIVDVFNMHKKASWSNHSQAEIGFSITDKVSKSSIFLGIWFEAWETYGIPICITLNYVGHGITDKYDEIKKAIDNRNEKGLKFIHDYQGYAIVLIEHEYYNFENDAERIFRLFNDLRYMIGIKAI